MRSQELLAFIASFLILPVTLSARDASPLFPPAPAPSAPQAAAEPSLTLDLDHAPLPLGDMVVGRDAFEFYRDAHSAPLTNGLYTAYFRSPIDAVRLPEPFSIGDVIDYSDGTIQAVPTSTVRLMIPDGRLQPYLAVARQTNDVDETLRMGVGVGLRYRITADFSVTSDVISFASDNQSRSSIARQSETVWVVRLEWGF